MSYSAVNWTVRSVTVVVVGMLIAGLFGPSAQAAHQSWVVDSFDDGQDVAPGDGQCDAGNGVCTLRAAIQETNAHPGEDEIIVPAGTYSLTIPPGFEEPTPFPDDAHGDLDITDDVIITGDGPETTVVDANGIDRVMQIWDNRTVFPTDGPAFFPTVDISGIGLTNGVAPATECCPQGGGIYIVSGDVTLDDVHVYGNTAKVDPCAPESTCPSGEGGGIYSSDQLTLTDSAVFDNVSGERGGGIYHQAGLLSIERSLVGGNTAVSRGGGIYIRDTSGSTIVDTTIEGNTARDDDGGGVYNRSFGDGEPGLTLERVSLLTNSAGDQGGGLLNAFDDAYIVNSTFHGNSAWRGGGIYNQDAFLTLDNVTVANNVAEAGGDAGGGIFDSYEPCRFCEVGDTILTNSILAYNEPDQCGTDAEGRVRSPDEVSGNNLVYPEDTDCEFDDPGSIHGEDPLLEPPADNGGFTPTMALAAGSPAIDAGANETCPPEDQRLEERPQDGDGDGKAICDIGAYEVEKFQPPPSTPPPTQTMTPAPTQTTTPPSNSGGGGGGFSPQCSDFLDNDGDDKVDWNGNGNPAMADPDCTDASDNSEFPGAATATPTPAPTTAAPVTQSPSATPATTAATSTPTPTATGSVQPTPTPIPSVEPTPTPSATPTPEPSESPFVPPDEELIDTGSTIDFRPRQDEFWGRVTAQQDQDGENSGDRGATGFSFGTIDLAFADAQDQTPTPTPTPTPSPTGEESDAAPSSEMCETGRRVLLLKKRRGDDLVVGSDRVNKRDRWSVPVRERAKGEHYAVIPEKVIRADDGTIVICERARSRTAKPNR